MAKRGLSEDEVLALRPVRLAEWSENEAEAEAAESAGEAGRVTLTRPLPAVHGLGSLFRRISALTGAKRLRLDEPGSFLWRRIDGDRTAEELADALREAFGDAVEPAGERVARFLYNLDREQLVELRDAAGAQVKLGHL
jgi:hypothetical protein